MKKKSFAFGAGQFSLETLAGGRPGTASVQNPGGEGGGAGGCRIQGLGPAAPPGHGMLLPPHCLPCRNTVSRPGDPVPGGRGRSECDQISQAP